MQPKAKDNDSLSLTLRSDTAVIHEAIQEILEFLKTYAIRSTTEFSVVLRELLSNAIIHGNRNAPDLTVYCRIEAMGKGLFRIIVEDQGRGFDYTALDTTLPDDPRTLRTRGYVLITHICSSVDFNECGNRVTVCIGDHENTWETRHGLPESTQENHGCAIPRSCPVVAT